jgi:hypothetical protein
MRIARGPRPWPIWLFAGILLLVGLLRLIAQLHGFSHWSELEQSGLGLIDWDRERQIIMAFSVMTIILIPIVAIWLFASRIARIFVTALSVPGLLFGWVGSLLDGADYAAMLGLESMLCLAAISLLFTPAASRWLSDNKKEPVVAEG